MLSLRIIVSVMLVGESFSYSRQMIGSQRNRFQPYYQAGGYDKDNCNEEQCNNRRSSNDLSAMLHSLVGDPVDFADNEEAVDFWYESAVNNLNKRGHSENNGNVDYDFIATMSDPLTAQTFYSPQKKATYRNAKMLPCRCDVKWGPIYLGQNQYPNYMMAATCRTLMPSHTCKEQVIKVSVLKLREKGDSLKQVLFLPDDLRDKYIFVYKNLTVGCECIP